MKMDHHILYIGSYSEIHLFKYENEYSDKTFFLFNKGVV